MKSQKELIEKTDWDCLLVLDSLRFDNFKNTYKGIFGNGGELTKCKSPSTFTLGWIKECFGDRKRDDCVYISTDPVKQDIRDYTKRLHHGNSFDMRNHFKDVVDIYTEHFNGFVKPEIVNQYTEETIKKNPDCKIIVKYWQCHDHYIYYNGWNFKYKSYNLGNLRKIIYELVSDEFFWTICNKLGFPPENWLAALWLKEGQPGIFFGYQYDLELCLKHCKKLVDKYPDKKFAITGDHSEHLGEHGGRYSHGGRWKEIREVPWFKVKKN